MSTPDRTPLPPAVLAAFRKAIRKPIGDHYYINMDTSCACDACLSLALTAALEAMPKDVEQQVPAPAPSGEPLAERTWLTTPQDGMTDEERTMILNLLDRARDAFQVPGLHWATSNLEAVVARCHEKWLAARGVIYFPDAGGSSGRPAEEHHPHPGA